MINYFSKTLLIGTTLLSLFPLTWPAYGEYLPEQRPGWCKNEVVGRYNTFMADVTITGTSKNRVSWRVDSTGRTGNCIFNEKNQFVKILVNPSEEHYRATGSIYWNSQINKWIAPDGGVCHTCTPTNGFPIPPKTQDGFFYLPNEQIWYDPDGHACYTCTPANGFAVN